MLVTLSMGDDKGLLCDLVLGEERMRALLVGSSLEGTLLILTFPEELEYA